MDNYCIFVETKPKNMNTQIKVTANKARRTYTIKLNGTVYRTFQMTKEEFEDNSWNTKGDWCNYIRYNSVITVR